MKWKGSGSCLSKLTGKLCGLHFLGGNLGLADAVSSAHLLHGGDVFGLEVDEALVEALHLGLDHEVGHGELKVGSRRVHESVTVHLNYLSIIITTQSLTGLS